MFFVTVGCLCSGEGVRHGGGGGAELARVPLLRGHVRAMLCDVLLLSEARLSGSRPSCVANSLDWCKVECAVFRSFQLLDSEYFLHL